MKTWDDNNSVDEPKAFVPINIDLVYYNISLRSYRFTPRFLRGNPLFKDMDIERYQYRRNDYDNINEFVLYNLSDCEYSEYEMMMFFDIDEYLNPIFNDLNKELRDAKLFELETKFPTRTYSTSETYTTKTIYTEDQLRDLKRSMFL